MNDRLRIASEQLAALNSCENVGGTAESRAKWALEEADALLAAAGEQEAFSGPDFYTSMVRYRDEALAQLAHAEAAEARAAELQAKLDEAAALKDENQKMHHDWMADHAEMESLKDELAECQEANHSVAVCRDHTSDIITRNGCVICELAKYTEPLTDKQRSSLFGDINFCLAIDTDNLDMIDAAIRLVRRGE